MKMPEEKSKHFKIIVVGDSCVGKTSLMSQLVNGLFLNSVRTTVGVDFMSKEFIIDDQEVILQIWDTAGQERFQSLGNSFYRGAQCCVIVYDVTRPQTLDSVQYWRKEFLEIAQPKNPNVFPIVIIGNKLDLLHEGVGIPCKYQKNSDEKAYNITSFETSAKDRSDVHLKFLQIAETILQSQIDEQYEIIQPEEIKLLHVPDGNYLLSNCC